jgi:hypothetical protein
MIDDAENPIDIIVDVFDEYPSVSYCTDGFLSINRSAVFVELLTIISVVVLIIFCDKNSIGNI